MKVNNSSSSTIVLKRGVITVMLTPGENSIQEYDWIESVIARHSDIEYIKDVIITDIGTIDESSKVTTTTEKRTVISVKPDTIVEDEVVVKPVPKKTRKKTTTKKKSSGKHS